jgi:membrane protease YdiL (CAAX protease family)
MGVTAIVLLVVAKVWQYLGSVALMPLQFSLNAFLLGIGLAIAITLASAIAHRFWAAYRRSADFYLELVLKPLIFADFIWLGLLPGLSEELLFRGVMLPALGMNLIALIFSSILFGVLHFSGTQQWPYIVWATAIGFVLGLTALITGNLLIPIVAHILTNFLSGCVWKWQNPVKLPESQ